MEGAPTWNLVVENNQLFLLVNEKKAVECNGKNLVVEQVGHGKSTNEIRVKLIGVKLGRNLFLSNLYVKSEYQVRTVTELIEKIASTCPWIEIYSRKRKTDTKEKETSTKKTKVIIDEIDTIDYVMKKLSPIPMGNNYLGKFEVNILTLMPPPEKYLVRKVNHDWVRLLRQKIEKYPNVVSTIFPVLIDPLQVKERSEFSAEKLSTYQLYTLGGNHLRTAMQNLAKEAYLDEIRNVQIHLYFELNEQEAMTVSNSHNGTQAYLKPTFQDTVYQALKLKEANKTSLPASVAQMLSEIEMKEVAKESVGTIVSVANYGQVNMKLYNLLVTKFQQKNGSFKSIPQNLFKELQGIKDEDRTSFLQDALDKSIEVSLRKVKLAKKRKKLEECMMKITKCKTPDSCKEIYPDHWDGIDRFIGLEITKNVIPAVFVEYCQEASETADLDDCVLKDFNPEIKFTVTLNGKDITQIRNIETILNTYKKKAFLKLVKKQNEILKAVDESICTEKDDTMTISNDSGFSDTSIDISDSAFIQDESLTDSLTDLLNESNAETQPPENCTSQDLFSN
ncbi:uncharacterized protein LOC134685183 [Mytilus trossulus]|uniref:uncharacterized protein LOC134685183 n=1 Tax=Mytilus trossulus TaxID=6551 RepID=UPI003005B09A